MKLLDLVEECTGSLISWLGDRSTLAMASDDEISLMSLSDEEKEEKKEPKPAPSAALPQPGGLSKPASAAFPQPGGSSNKEADLLDQATLWAEVG